MAMTATTITRKQLGKDYIIHIISSIMRQIDLGRPPFYYSDGLVTLGGDENGKCAKSKV